MKANRAAVPMFLAPIPMERFFTEYWGRKRLAIHRNDPDYFHEVADFRELDRLVGCVRIPASNFNLAKDDTPLPLSSYCSGSFVDKNRALTLHRQGATIILRSVEQWSPMANRVRIAAEEFFRCAAQVNVYLTPPSEKSTPPHWDTHDLIVLQVEGSKRWRLYGGARTLPLADEQFRIGEDCVSPEFEEVALDVGDTLYLPRGVIHEPVADTYSAHLSIGLQTFRWHDLLDVALRLLAGREGSRLRETFTLAPNVVEQPPDLALLADLLAPETLQRAAEILSERFNQNRAIDFEGWLLEVRHGPRLDAKQRYWRRAGVCWRVCKTEAGVDVIVGDQSVTVPPSLSAAVEYVIGHDSFTAAELPIEDASLSGVAMCLALQDIGALRTTTWHNPE